MEMSEVRARVAEVPDDWSPCQVAAHCAPLWRPTNPDQRTNRESQGSKTRGGKVFEKVCLAIMERAQITGAMAQVQFNHGGHKFDFCLWPETAPLKPIDDPPILLSCKASITSDRFDGVLWEGQCGKHLAGGALVYVLDGEGKIFNPDRQIRQAQLLGANNIDGVIRVTTPDFDKFIKTLPRVCTTEPIARPIYGKEIW